MQYVGKVFSTVTEFYKEINPATLSGAIDIIVVQLPDGTYRCSPFHVRFGKLQILRPQDKRVEVAINGRPVDLNMKVGDAGEAFFVLETENPVPSEYATSPIAAPTTEEESEVPEYLDLQHGLSEYDEQLDENAGGYVSASSGSEYGDDSEDDNGFDSPSPRPRRASSPSQLGEAAAANGLSSAILDEKLENVTENGDFAKTMAAVEGTVPADPSAKGDNPNLQVETREEQSGKRVRLRPDSVAGVVGMKTLRPSDSFAEHAARASNKGADTAASASEASGQEEQQEGAERDLDGEGQEARNRPTEDAGKTAQQDQRKSSEDYSTELRHPEETTRSDEGPDLKLVTSSTTTMTSTESYIPASATSSTAQVLSCSAITDSVLGDSRPDRAGPLISAALTDQHPQAREARKADRLPLASIDSRPPDARSSSSDGRLGRVRTHSVPRKLTATVAAQLDDPKRRDHRLGVGIGNGRNKQDYEDRFSDTELDHRTPPRQTSRSGDEDEGRKSRQEWFWGWGRLPEKRQNGIGNGSPAELNNLDRPPSSLPEPSPNIERSPTASFSGLDSAGSDEFHDFQVTESEGLLVGEKRYKIDISLCGGTQFGKDEARNEALFRQHQITYEAFCTNPFILNDPALVFRYEGRYLNYTAASALMASLVLFRRPLPDVFALRPPQSVPAASDGRRYSFSGGWRHWWSRPSPSTPVKQGSEPAPATRFALRHPSHAPQRGRSELRSDVGLLRSATSPVDGLAERVEELYGDSQHPQQQPGPVRKNYAKTLRLTSDQLKNLNLHSGVNTVTFSVTRSYQGKATCAAKIFLWKQEMNIVISDIDGTITKSDALGHLFNIVGKDWTHAGVAKLYTEIASNNYQILYLTSRAIGQADSTREYLKKIEQDKYQLPDGPVIMSPDRLLTAFHREVIMRRPEVFKIACLRDIAKLFGDRNPFYAGFGNRITDALSYRSVNVPSSRIFTIDSTGDVKLELLTGYKSSYIKLGDLVHLIFPPVADAERAKIEEEYNDFNYWKPTLPAIDLPENLPDEPITAQPKRSAMA